MTDDDLTGEERDRLRRARVDPAPPRALEDQTVEALRRRGLLRRSRRSLVAVGWPVAAAAALAAAVTWMALHRSSTPGAAATGPRFVLLLYAGAEPVDGSPETRRREYAQWARDIASRGVSISGEELSDDAHEIPAATGSPAVQAPLPRGFFIVEAPDLASAERLASTCPHLRYGGRIIVKRILS